MKNKWGIYILLFIKGLKLSNKVEHVYNFGSSVCGYSNSRKYVSISKLRYMLLRFIMAYSQLKRNFLSSIVRLKEFGYFIIERRNYYTFNDVTLLHYITKLIYKIYAYYRISLIENVVRSIYCSSTRTHKRTRLYYFL